MSFISKVSKSLSSSRLMVSSILGSRLRHISTVWVDLVSLVFRYLTYTMYVVPSSIRIWTNIFHYLQKLISNIPVAEQRDIFDEAFLWFIFVCSLWGEKHDFPVDVILRSDKYPVVKTHIYLYHNPRDTSFTSFNVPAEQQNYKFQIVIHVKIAKKMVNQKPSVLIIDVSSVLVTFLYLKIHVLFIYRIRGGFQVINDVR